MFRTFLLLFMDKIIYNIDLIWFFPFIRKFRTREDFQISSQEQQQQQKEQESQACMQDSTNTNPKASLLLSQKK